MDQVDLPQVRLGRVARDARAVLDGRPGVRIALDAPARDQGDLVDHGLAEPMGTSSRLTAITRGCRHGCRSWSDSGAGPGSAHR